MKTKQIIAAIKASTTNKSGVPLTTLAFLNGKHILTSTLDVFLEMPFMCNHSVSVDAKMLCTIWDTIGNHIPPSSASDTSVEFINGTRKLKTANLGEEKLIYNKFNEESKLVGIIDIEDLEHIKSAAKYVGNDELRRSLMNVCLRDNRIAATDTHRLYFSQPKDTLPNKELVLLSKTTVSLLTIFDPQRWDIYINSDGAATLVSENGIRIHDRALLIDNRFPNYIDIIPEESKKIFTITANVKEIKDIIKVGSKFANQNARRVILDCTDQAVTALFNDEDLGNEYKDVIQSASFKSKVKENEGLEIGFNYAYLSECLSDCGDSVTMELCGPTRAAILNGKLLLMPVMITN